MRVLGLEKDDTYTAQDFTMPYETTEELAKRGLVKVIYGEGTAPADTTVAETLDQTTDSHSEPDVEQVPETLDTEPVSETPVEEPVIDSHSEQSEESQTSTEPATEQPTPDLDGFRPEQLAVRYRHSFLSKLIQSDKELQQIYTEIKNLLLSYRGVKARMSFANETFKKAKVHISKLNVKGKSLTV